MEGILNLIGNETYFVPLNRGEKCHIRYCVSFVNRLRSILQQLSSKHGGSGANLKENEC